MRALTVTWTLLVLAALGAIAFVQVREFQIAEVAREETFAREVKMFCASVGRGEFLTLDDTICDRVRHRLSISSEDYGGLLDISLAIATGDGARKDIARRLGSDVWAAATHADTRLDLVAEAIHTAALTARGVLALPPK